jgi:hypothetical protein
MNLKVSFPLGVESRLGHRIFAVVQNLERSGRMRILPRGVLFLSQSLD